VRYRRLTYRYTMVVQSAPTWPLGGVWQNEGVRLLVQGRWRPDADVYETAATVEVVVDLAGLQDDDFEVQLFEDVLVVEGQRRLPSSEEDTVYHAAGIRQGPFQVALTLPASVDAERVVARYERGLLRITLPRRAGAG
jgi:HSP20 family protein